MSVLGRCPPRGIALVLAGAAISGLDAMPQAALRTYADQAAGLVFQFPATFGEPSRGSDHGFEGRRVAVRFAAINADVILTSGPVLVDHQAVSALYDHFGLQLFPDADRVRITAALSPLDADSFCAALGSPDHLTGIVLSDRLMAMARSVDVMQRHDPRVDTCVREGALIRFSRTARTLPSPAAPSPFVFGAIHFLSGPYSSFQIVARGAQAPSAALLEEMERLVRSLATR